MSTDLATIDATGPRDVSAEQLAIFQIVGKIMHETRYYDLASPIRATFLMAKVYELGFPATSAPDVIDDIKGRLTLKPAAALALVFRSGLLEDMQVEDGPDFCEVKFKRRGLPFMLGYKFTMTDAAKADLVKQGGAWEKWTKNMLYWRAVGFAVDRVFPDVTLGMKDNVQFGAALPQGRVDTTTGEITVIDVAQEG